MERTLFLCEIDKPSKALLILFHKEKMKNMNCIRTGVMMSISIAIFLLATAIHAQNVNSNVTELIKYWGYPVEQHYATTSDGYILSL